MQQKHFVFALTFCWIERLIEYIIVLNGRAVVGGLNQAFALWQDVICIYQSATCGREQSTLMSNTDLTSVNVRCYS